MVGVNYGTVANNLPTPAVTAKLILSTSLRSVKLYDADVSILQALANTNIKVGTFLIQTQIIINELSSCQCPSCIFPSMSPPPCHIIIRNFQSTRSSTVLLEVI